MLAGLSASGKSTLIRAACGLVPHFHGGEARGRVIVGGLDTRSHGPGELAAVCGTLLQEPETQIVMGTVRAEIAFPLENRGLGAGGGRARGRGGSARARHRRAARAADARALRRRAPARRARRGARHAPRARAARRADLAARPGRGRRARLAAAATQRGVGDGGRARRAPARALPAHADRVARVQDGRLACDAPPQQMLDWAAEHSPALLTPSARLFARAGLRPLPAGVKEARATLRAHGLLDEPPAARAAPGGRSAPRPTAAPAGGRGAFARAPRARRAAVRTRRCAPSACGTSSQAAARSCAASTSRSRPARASR